MGFSAILVFSAVKMIGERGSEDDSDFADSAVMWLARKMFDATDHYDETEECEREAAAIWLQSMVRGGGDMAAHQKAAIGNAVRSARKIEQDAADQRVAEANAMKKQELEWLRADCEEERAEAVKSAASDAVLQAPETADRACAVSYTHLKLQTKA